MFSSHLFKKPLSVDEAISGVNTAIANLEAVAAIEKAKSDELTATIQTLDEQRDTAQLEHRRATSIAQKLKDLVGV